MRARIAEPTEVREIFGGRYDGAFTVEAMAPCCGEKVTHIMEFQEHGPSHRVCNAQCGGSYELARPKPMGLLDVPHKWWKDRVRFLPEIDNLGFGTAGMDGAAGLLGKVA